MDLREEYLQKYIQFHSSFGTAIQAIRYINENFPVFAKAHFDSKQDELDTFWKTLHEKDPETWTLVNRLYQEASSGNQPNLYGLPEKVTINWLNLL